MIGRFLLLAEFEFYLNVLPSLALCMILGANNLSTCLGTSMGARTLTYSQALGLASIGLLAGVLLEGHKLVGAITSGIVFSKDPELFFATALSTFLIMTLFTYRKLPISLSQVAVGAAVGSALAHRIAVNWIFAAHVAVSWLLTPIFGFLIATGSSAITRAVAKRVKRALTLNVWYAYLTILGGVYSSYALGANTVGLIVGMTDLPLSQRLFISLLLGAATVLGMILFSRGTTRSVAENIIGLNPSASFAAQMGGAATVHGFTQFGIPVSVSQGVVGGILGASIPRKIVVRNDRLTREIILGWTIAPLLGATLAFLVAQLLF